MKLEKTVLSFGNPVQRCQAIAKSGKQCSQPAVKGKLYCHNKSHNLKKSRAQDIKTPVVDIVCVEQPRQPEPPEPKINTEIWGKIVFDFMKSTQKYVGIR